MSKAVLSAWITGDTLQYKGLNISQKLSQFSSPLFQEISNNSCIFFLSNRELNFYISFLHCLFYFQPIKIKNSRQFLEAPKNEKTFLISPPSSPPVGWEQVLEDPPVVNLEFLATLSTKLNPCKLLKEQKNVFQNMKS